MGKSNIASSLIPSETLNSFYGIMFAKSPDPLLEIRTYLDGMICSEFEANSPRLDYYVGAIDNYREELLAGGIRADVVKERVDPLLKIFKESLSTGVKFCDVDYKSYNINDLPRITVEVSSVLVRQGMAHTQSFLEELEKYKSVSVVALAPYNMLITNPMFVDQPKWLKKPSVAVDLASEKPEPENQ